jgi:Inositol polyphosphate kinase
MAQIDYGRESVREDVLARARHKASKWLSYQVSGADQLVGQVGGISKHKRPLLTLDPDYVLKPLQLDHRGIRELSFYEALNAASHTSGSKVYVDFVVSKRDPVKPSWIDVVAFSIAFVLQDPYVLECEQRILKAWAKVESEAKLLRRLYRFVPAYFGMVRHETSQNSQDAAHVVPGPFGIHSDCYLLLQDVTVQFEKPCVVDLKMGFRTFEPDAPDSKKKREKEKYPQQETFGFRIVGKRIYIPSHKDAGDNGFVFYPKQVGLSLGSYEGLKEAFVTFFGLENLDASFLPARLKTITSILLKLRSLQHWFRDNKQFCFYASSLLIAYEGDQEPDGNPEMVIVKMIDFGRVRRQKGGDPGYLKGLTIVASLVEETLKEWGMNSENGG